MQDQIACTPDVYRLCGQFIPNEDTIVTCLKANKAKLSAGCKEVFSRTVVTPPKAPEPDSEDD